MRILLINPPSDHDVSMFVLDDYNEKARSYQIPLWALYLHSYLERKHDVQIVDMDAHEMEIHAVQGIIDAVQPDIIGITVTIGKWLTVKALAKYIKLLYDIPIVTGGVNASLYPWETLQNKNIDYAISGSGQIPLMELCNAIENKKDVNNIKNVHTWFNCDKNTIGTFEFVNVDDFPMPDRSILNINDYVMPFFGDSNPVTSSFTSFGCPFSCKYCFCCTFKPLIFRTPENIVSEMKNIESLGIKGILFNDELFTLNIKRIEEICSLIISEGINLKISLRSRANLVNKESLKMLKDAGIFNIHMGIENGNDRILEKMNKKLTVDTIKKSVEMIKESGIGATASFMIGYLSETESEIMKTIQFAKELELDNSQYFIVQPEPGTPLYEEVKEIKNLPDDVYSEFILSSDESILKNNIASNIFSKEELENYIKYAYTQTRNLYDIKKEYEK